VKEKKREQENLNRNNGGECVCDQQSVAMPTCTIQSNRSNIGMKDKPAYSILKHSKSNAKHYKRKKLEFLKIKSSLLCLSPEILLPVTCFHSLLFC
jgi:hypothetical protein